MSGNSHTAGSTRETHRIRLDGAEGAVAVTKLVSKGERLGIRDGDTGVKLDALLLEGLTWQRDRGTLDDLLGADGAVAGDPVAAATDGSADDTDESTDDISISNEYSHVLVRAVTTDAGAGIEVTTPGRGTAITLGVRSLRELAAVEDTYAFSDWFKTPFGPEDTPVEGPL